jgi:hypothetical protein
MLQTLRAPAGRAAGSFKGGLIQTALENGIGAALGEAFGYNPNVYPGALAGHELQALQKASSYKKGAHMLGVGRSNEAGIDAIDLDNVRGISLKSASNLERAKDAAVEAEKSAAKAGFYNVEVYIDAPTVSKADASGLKKIQSMLGTGIIDKVVIFGRDGAVEYVPSPEQVKQICQKAGSACQ